MRYLLYAALAAALTFFITLPILGVHLNQSAQGLSLTGQWQHCLYAAAVVFVAQLLLPLAIQAKHRLPRNPRFSPAAYIENHRGVVLALLIVAAFLVPVFGSRGAVNVATLALIYVMLGLSLNIVVGYAGLLDLGHVAFYAVGAYCYAILAQHGVGFWTTLPIAALLTGTLGLLLGFPVLRLRGDYLAIVTLGFGEIIRILLNNLDSLTNGPKGINNIPKPGLFNIVFTRKGGAGETPFHELVGIPFSTEQRGIFLYLIILGLIRRHGQKQITHIPIPVTTENRDLIIIVGTYAEFIRQRGGFPTQPLGVGREVVELDGPWELHECIGPGDEFLRGEYDHDISFLVNAATSYPSLSLRMALPSKPNTAHPHPIIKPEFSRENTTAPVA